MFKGGLYSRRAHIWRVDINHVQHHPEREKQERVGTARPIRVRLTPARHPQSCLPPSRRDVRKPAAFIYPDDAFAQHYTATTALNAQCGGGAPKSRKKVPRAVTLNRCRGAIKLWRRKPCRLHRSKRKLVVGRWALPAGAVSD